MAEPLRRVQYAVGVLVAAACTSGCEWRPPFVLLSVDDPAGAADQATALYVGAERGALVRVELSGEFSLPARVTLTSGAPGQKTVVVEARNVDGVALARGETLATFRRRGTPTARVSLARTCVDDTDCASEAFCENLSACVGAVCVDVGPRCSSGFSCVISRCVESERRCDVTVDHAECGSGKFCSLSAGCVSGDPCLESVDCDDGDPCNGNEECIDFRCWPGTKLEVDDGDPCTVDGCDGRRVDSGLDPVFNELSPATDGVRCSLGGSAEGICLFERGGCWESVCGDGIVDAAVRSEVCDAGQENSDEWSLEPRCNTTCGGANPHCGDGTVATGFEACDAGSANDDHWSLTPRCNASCSGWAPHCGDGVVEPGVELCDDGPSNSDAWSQTGHCNANCTGLAPFCGDDLVDPGFETCDDGTLNGDAWVASPHCNALCDGFGEHCGDGVLQTPFEQCEDGVHADSGNGCSAECQENHVCGDGAVQTLYEACDDGADGDNCDACRDDCTIPCDCVRDDCGTSAWCDDGLCVACDTSQHCGVSCIACDAEQPICSGVSTGCECDPDPVPRGSCLPGSRCSSGACVSCNDVTACGPECVACSGDTPVCAGPEVGCVVDPATGCAGMADFTPCTVTTSPERLYDICVDGVCLSPGCGDVSCNVPGPGFVLPDTHQRSCYDVGPTACPGLAGDPSCGSTSGCGQDAQYGWDLSHPPGSRFTRIEPGDGEPTVVDTITGLLWQGCPAGTRGSDCSTGVHSVFNHDPAITHCEGLSWAGYTDWRLPSAFELLSLGEYGITRPCIDEVVFPDSGPSGYWSSDSDVENSFRGRFVNFDQCTTGDTGATTSFRVRCVRRLSPWVQSSVDRFAVSSAVLDQPVVSDAGTGLDWQGCPAGLSDIACSTGALASETWEAALALCEDLDWGGYTDWRLPNIRELGSIVDYRRISPATDATVFVQTPNWRFWTSTADPDSSGKVRWVEFSVGARGILLNSELHHVRCTRGESGL